MLPRPIPATAMRRRTSHASRWRRAATHLEFVFVLPWFLLFIVFSLNMGVLIVQYGGLQNATNAAARAGAQVGGAEVGDASQTVFRQQLESFAGVDADDVQLRVLSGHSCTTSGPNRDVVIEAGYGAPLAIPGMGGIMRLVGADDSNASNFHLQSRAVARCEVVRR